VLSSNLIAVDQNLVTDLFNEAATHNID